MRSRGWASYGALMATLAVASVFVVGIRARTADLEFEDKTLARIQARWALRSTILMSAKRLRLGEKPYLGAIRMGSKVWCRATVSPRQDKDEGIWLLRARARCRYPKDRSIQFELTRKVSERGYMRR